MILLTPKFAESFETGSDKANVDRLRTDPSKDCGSRFAVENRDDDDDDDCSRLYDEAYIEVFSPTVFETVEIYTSTSSSSWSSSSSCCTIADNSDSPDPCTEVSVADAESGGAMIDEEISLGTLDATAVSSLEQLEPGTYTLDVLESTDFDFDAVFVDSSTTTTSPPNFDARTTTVSGGAATSVIRVDGRVAGVANETMAGGDERHSDGEGDDDDDDDDDDADADADGGDDDDDDEDWQEERTRKSGTRKLRAGSRRKSPATEHPSPPLPPPRIVSAREFLRSFSNDLRRTEVGHVANHEDESKSLSWLLDFKISSIFHPVEGDPDHFEKSKKKSNDSSRKPRYTYTELIEQALKENGELTVSGIYNWISKHYPYYQQNDDRWKNSVRHNLSINPQFRKGKKASQGAGHFWNISDTATQCIESNNINTNGCSANNNKDKSKMLSKSISDIINQIDEEVLAATKSIQENENMDFTDVSLHDAAEQQLQIDKTNRNVENSFVHITKNDIEHLWESTHDTSDQRFVSFSPLIRELTEESSSMDDENFLIQDIHNSICLGDELFANGLNSLCYGLTTI